MSAIDDCREMGLLPEEAKRWHDRRQMHEREADELHMGPYPSDIDYYAIESLAAALLEQTQAYDDLDSWDGHLRWLDSWYPASIFGAPGDVPKNALDTGCSNVILTRALAAEKARAESQLAAACEDVQMYGAANGDLKDQLAAATEELAALKEPPTDGDAAYWHTAWKVLEAELQRDIARYKDSAKAQGTVIFELRGECELAYEQLQAKTAENQSLRSMLIDGTTEGNVLLARYDARAPHPSQGGGE